MSEIECTPSQTTKFNAPIAIPLDILNRKPINSTYATSKVDSYFGQIPDGFNPRDVYRVLDLVLDKLYVDKTPPEIVAQELGHPLSFINRVKAKIDSQEHRRRIPTFQLP